MVSGFSELLRNATMALDRDCLSTLPNELLHQIFEYLSTAPPSASRLKLAPSPTLTDSPHSTLKSISLASKKLRRVVLEHLFSHLRYKIWPWHLRRAELNGSYGCIIGSKEYKEGVEPVVERWPPGYYRMLKFLINAELTKYVQSMTIIIEAERVWYGSLFEAWTRLTDLCPDPAIFPEVDRLNVVAPFIILKGLLRRGTHKEKAWDLESPYGPYRTVSFHVSSEAEQENQSSRPRLHSRPPIPSNPAFWGDITLNEGYPFSQEISGDLFLTALINLAKDDDHEQPPEMFRSHISLLRKPTQSFTYVAMYPPQSHVYEVMRRVLSYTTHLNLQLLPHSNTLEEWNVKDPTGESMNRLNERYIRKFCSRFFKQIAYLPLRNPDGSSLESITMLDGFVGRKKGIWRYILHSARRMRRLDICWEDETAQHGVVGLVRKKEATNS